MTKNSSSKISAFSWKIFQFLENHNISLKNKSYLISFSGGSDSTALLRVFLEIQKKIKIKLFLAHFHHGIRLKSDLESEIVQKTAKEFDIPCFIFHQKIQEPAIQEKARKWRYQELEKLRKKKKIDFILLGHHLDDLVETQIWRLLRGASLFDLVAMLPKKKYYLRPLLYTSKKEILIYLKQLKQKWIEDESNQEEYYTRNYIRNQIIPKMKNIFSIESEEKFLQKMLSLHQESIGLNKIYQDQTKKVDKEFLTFQEISSLPELFAKKFLHDFLIMKGRKKLT